MSQRAHVIYREPASLFHPNGWISPAHCLENQAAAERLRDATNLLSGRGAAVRRTWHITDCPGDDCGVRR
ncbi:MULTISPECIES: hypothetical protein [Saccharothrix]|uniref:hypothetical protein n=1 Tax=Saccharothrix TaxID=2071 RepID=UPI001161281F|nr:hypothetical protein [Saccharothrix sp. CB00851]